MAETIIKYLLYLSSIYFVNANQFVNDSFYPRYHPAPPYGWMNDPNGFVYYQGVYHLFYQFNPQSSLEPGIANWGHLKSPDLVHWQHEPIAMRPDESYDRDGVFSGSAIVVNKTLHLLYTGNNNNPAQQVQALASSTDGVKIKKYPYNPVIRGNEFQPNLRDPKVWKHGNTYYMVLGNSFENGTRGRVLLYSSKDLLDWEYENVIDESDGSLGYMWECPDFFPLNGKFVLLFSPQGIATQGDKYKNLYQCGYIVGDFNYTTKKFKSLTSFVELDNGHDFYATQTTLDKLSRRVLVAWNDMWETNYPEGSNGFTGQMTVVRSLSLDKNNRLIQKPISNLMSLRVKTLYSGYGREGKSVTLANRAGEIFISASKNNDFVLNITGVKQSVILSYSSQNHTVTLNRGGEDSTRVAEWNPKARIHWRVFVDASSVELFCGNGEVTFSSRFFPNSDINVKIGPTSRADLFNVYALRTSVPRGGENGVTL